MAQAVERDRGAPSVTFEVERFEAQGQDRMVLSGRWYGLRGRRFVRPTITMGTEGHRQRALADLDHKPWAAHDGEFWEAAFPCKPNGEDLGKIELTVAPDITVALPPPGAGAAEQRIRARPRRDDLLDSLRGARRDGRRASGSGNGADPVRAGRSATRRDDGLEAQREAPRAPQTPSPASAAAGADGAPAPRPTRRRPPGSPELVQRLSQAQREIEGLRTDLARHENASIEATSALNRRDAAVSRLNEAISARDQATRARDQAVRGRDQAYRERDRMAKERDQALRDRDRATAKAEKLAEAATAARGDHRVGARTMTSPVTMWAQRILAVTVLVIVVLAFAITARLL